MFVLHLFLKYTKHNAKHTDTYSHYHKLFLLFLLFWPASIALIWMSLIEYMKMLMWFKFECTSLKSVCILFAGSMTNIQLHTFGLARYTYIVLSCLCHSNGKHVAQIYCDNDFQSITEQGAIINFSLLDCHGRTVGYSQVRQNLLLVVNVILSFSFGLFLCFP